MTIIVYYFCQAGLSQTLLSGQAVSGEFYVSDRDRQSALPQAEISAIFAEVSGAIQTANLATDLAAKLTPFASTRLSVRIILTKHSPPRSANRPNKR